MYSHIHIFIYNCIYITASEDTDRVNPNLVPRAGRRQRIIRSIYLSICIAISLSVYLCIYLYTHLSIYSSR